MNFRKWLLAAICLFIVGLIIGIVAPQNISGMISGEAEALEALAKYISSLPPYMAALLVFAKNAVALLLGFAFSPLLCLLPLVTLLTNGWLLGFVSVIVIQEESLGFLLAGILPHGIVEIPALIIGEAAALSCGATVIMALFRRDKEKLLATLSVNIKYLAIALALLLPAAFIEIYITPLFLR